MTLWNVLSVNCCTCKGTIERGGVGTREFGVEQLGVRGFVTEKYPKTINH